MRWRTRELAGRQLRATGGSAFRIRAPDVAALRVDSSIGALQRSGRAPPTKDRSRCVIDPAWRDRCAKRCCAMAERRGLTRRTRGSIGFSAGLHDLLGYRAD